MNLEQQLRLALAPRQPGPEPLAAVMARVAARRGARRPGRPILLGTILAVAAAAAMLAAHWSASRQQAGTASTATTASAAEPQVAPPVEPVAHAIGEPAAPEESPPSAATDASAQSSLRTVLLRPLRIESDDPAVRAALREYYATIADGLRAVPGLLLLETDRAGDSAATDFDFRLTFVGSADDGSAQVAVMPDDKGEVSVQVRRQPASRALRSWRMQIVLEERALKKMMVTLTSGRLPSDCGGPDGRSTMCRSPAAQAAHTLESLRITILPEDSELRRSLQTRVLDVRQSYATRFDALELLARNTAAGDLGPEIIRAAFDLVANAPGGYGGERIMDLLRGHGQPVLLHALIDMSSREPDTALRMQALSILVAEYKADPAARGALESIAATDRLPLARQVAGRALSGDGAWNEYVVATVKDASLPPAERFAPLAHMVRTGQKADARKLLDDDVIAALLDVLPSVVDDTNSAVSSAVELLATLAGAAQPAVIDLMLASLDAARTLSSRVFIVQGLQRHRDDPRVRSKLQEVAAGDQNPQVREAAVAALNPPEPLPGR